MAWETESWLNSFIVTTPIRSRRSIVCPALVAGFEPIGGSSLISPAAREALCALATPSLA